MKKIYLIICGACIILVNVISFVIPSDFNKTFLISYVSCMFYFIVSCALVMAIKKEEIYTLGKYYIYYSLGIFSIISTFILKFIETELTWLPIVIYTIIFIILLLSYITMKMGNNHIKQIESKIKEKINYINDLKIQIEILIESNTKIEKDKLINLHSLIVDSDTISIKEVHTLEEKIKNKVYELKKSENENLIDEIKLLIIERNKKIKAYK